MFNASFWLLQLSDHIDAATVTFIPQPEYGRECIVYVFDADRLLPAHDVLMAHMGRSAAVMVVYLPGFGPLRSTQERLGDLAMRMAMRLDRTLLGLGVEAVQAALDLIESKWPGLRITAESHGVDAGNVIAFATALDERIAQAHVNDGIATFERVFTSPVPAVAPATMSIEGLAAQVDVPDLQRLAGQSRLLIESESDLRDYVIDLRPVAARVSSDRSPRASGSEGRWR